MSAGGMAVFDRTAIKPLPLQGQLKDGDFVYSSANIDASQIVNKTHYLV